MYLCRQVHFSTLPPQPVIPSKRPFKVELVGGKRYSWCTCGHSKKQVNTPLMSACITLVWSTHPADSLIISSSFSLSAMELTRPKPKACPLYGSSQRKTPQFGCVLASTRTTPLTVMARTSRTLSYRPLYTSRRTLRKEGGDVLELAVHVAAASWCLYINAFCESF